MEEAKEPHHITSGSSPKHACMLASPRIRGGADFAVQCTHVASSRCHTHPRRVTRLPGYASRCEDKCHSSIRQNHIDVRDVVACLYSFTLSLMTRLKRTQVRAILTDWGASQVPQVRPWMSMQLLGSSVDYLTYRKDQEVWKMCFPRKVSASSACTCIFLCLIICVV